MSGTGTRIRERFESDGFVFPIDAMTSEQAANYRLQLEDFETKYREQREIRRCLRRYPNLVLPFVDEISRLPAITDAVAEILGPDLLALDTPFFIKEANTTSFVSWHQDLHYWGIEGDEEVTAWVALSPASSQAGCMRFVAGSHKQKVEHRDTFNEDNLLSRGQEVAVDVDDSDATDAELKPGQCSLHHGRVFHASNPNGTGDRRIGLAIRYIPAHATQTPGAEMAAMLVRGEDRYGHFRECHRPAGLATPEALAHWEEIAMARNKVMMEGAQPTA